MPFCNGRLADGRSEFLNYFGFVHKALRPGSKAHLCQFRIVVSSDQNNPCTGAGPAQRFGYFQSVHWGHCEIKNNDVRIKASYNIESGNSGVNRGDDLEFRAQCCHQPSQHCGMIVSNSYSQFCVHLAPLGRHSAYRRSVGKKPMLQL